MSAFPIPDIALDKHLAILGKTGSGKSNTAKVIAERLMFAKHRVCIIDPTGTWWGIRLTPEGKKSRFEPVIFGGQHADIQVKPEHGAAIAEAIGTSSGSAIIDARLMTVGARTKFFTGFAEELLRTNQGPLHLIIDEAHLFAPQGRVNDPQSGAMLHAANNLVSLGRGIGLRIILISQRPAKLHKDSLTQVETLVAMRLIAPQDTAAINDWVGEWADPGKGKEITAGLPSLPTGDAWVWSPEINMLDRVHFPLAATFDSGTAKANEKAPALAPLDLGAIGAKLDSIRQEAISNDPATLKRRIAELEKAVTAKPSAPSAEQLQSARETGREKGYEAGYAEGYRSGRDIGGRQSSRRQMLRVVQALARAAEITGVAEAIESCLPAIEAIKIEEPAAPNQPAVERRAEPPPRAAPSLPPKELSRANTSADSADLTPAKRRILVALRELEAIGKAAPEKQTVAWFAGASPQSSAFSNNLGALRSGGYIDYPGPGLVALTGTGRDAEPARPAPTHDGIMALVAEKLAPAQLRMLQAAIAAYPSDLSTADLAEAVGASATSSAFSNNRGRLRSLGLIDYPSAGAVRAADLLFPEHG